MSFYAVAKGVIPGIYEDWTTAKEHVIGFPGALFKLFKSREEADEYMTIHTVRETVVPTPSTLTSGQLTSDRLTSDRLTSGQPTSGRLATLTLEQRAVFDALMEGKNIALLGSSGVG